MTFTALSPCNLVRVVGRGVVVEKVGSSLGAYSRSVIKILIIQRSSKTQLTALSHMGWRLEDGARGGQSTKKSMALQGFWQIYIQFRTVEIKRKVYRTVETVETVVTVYC